LLVLFAATERERHRITAQTHLGQRIEVIAVDLPAKAAVNRMLGPGRV